MKIATYVAGFVLFVGLCFSFAWGVNEQETLLQTSENFVNINSELNTQISEKRTHLQTLGETVMENITANQKLTQEFGSTEGFIE